MKTKEIFAKRVIELRKEKGITQTQLADMVGVSKTSANLYESASRVPDIQVLARYALVLGVSADYLLGLSDNKTAENQANGKELGLSDRAVEHLKNYKKLQDYSQNVSILYLPQELFDIIEDVYKNKSRIDLDELSTNISQMISVLNMLICEPEFLDILGKYLLSHKTKKDEEMSQADYEMLKLLTLQKYLFSLHERTKKMDKI